ncbi:MBL fold metallo-hydrolase [Pseudoalteromonas sp. MMG010]|uniref:MBL fold metallo-hydrolase n=1 Tax=Pseudoalteromonas sp. MMG010 TaxID=2822685 RepID=UPI001B39D3BE|nr:MBL fold metallo-hydrolase [Pseudoalteromonas sp. MMG010]MBQ4832318.1 MBL fold metallo-hydrolase [Pseudoalteromonas sp. MMG010]
MHVITVPVTPFAQNCRIIVCKKTNKAVIVDPGGDVDKITAQVASHRVEIQAIWLTHGHLDHVGVADILCKTYDVDILGPHKDEHFWFENLPMQAQMFGFAAKAPFYPTKYLNDLDSVKVGELEFLVKHCPGHTPGHIVFYQEQQQCVIVGDVIFKGAIGRTDFPQGNTEQLLTSIKQQIMCLPDKTIIMAGHGLNTTVGDEKSTNPFISGHFG